MGERLLYQPLTRWDVVTVVLYRAGIVISAAVVSLMSYFMLFGGPASPQRGKFTAALLLLYFSVGLSVFFIHLYVSRFHRSLEVFYLVALAALVLLLKWGGGDALAGLARPFAPLLLIPLAACLGFVTAKEAFCFGLNEGYLLALIMPFYLLVLSTGRMSQKSASYVLALIAVLLIFFTLRKVFMPLHYDIGDKSAYQ